MESNEGIFLTKSRIFHYFTSKYYPRNSVTAIWRASAGVQRAENVRKREGIFSCIVLEFTWLDGWMDLHSWFSGGYTPCFFKVYTTIVPLAFFFILSLERVLRERT